MKTYRLIDIFITLVMILVSGALSILAFGLLPFGLYVAGWLITLLLLVFGIALVQKGNYPELGLGLVIGSILGLVISVVFDVLGKIPF